MLILELGFSTQAELRTDSTASEGLASWLQDAIARLTLRTEKQAGSALSADVGR